MVSEEYVFGECGDATSKQEGYLISTFGYLDQFINKGVQSRAKYYIFIKDTSKMRNHRVLLYVPPNLEVGAHFLDSNIGCTTVFLRTAKNLEELTKQRAAVIEKNIKIPENVLMEFKEYILRQNCAT